MELSYLAATQRSVDAASRSIEAVVSDETLDRHGDVVDVGSWKLDRYKTNPVVLFMHNYSQPIGLTKKIWVEKKQLCAIMVLSDTERGREVLQLFVDGALRAFSVGFRVGRVAPDKRLADCELLEISAVSVPSNPNALVKHKSLGLVPPTYSVERRSGDEALRAVHKRLGYEEPRPDESAYDSLMRLKANVEREAADEYWRGEREKVR